MPDLVDYPSSSRRSEAEDFAVRVEDFPIHVSQMRCSRTYGFSDEFETLPEGSTASWDVAQRPENIQKNRYNNILPYDHARVILRSNSQIVSKVGFLSFGRITMNLGRLYQCELDFGLWCTVHCGTRADWSNGFRLLALCLPRKHSPYYHGHR